MNTDRFVAAEGDFVVAPCITCKRKSPFGPSCDAFKEGIPEAILDGSNQHRDLYPGDGGLLYEADNAS